MDWRWIKSLAMDWQIGIGLEDWQWIGGLALDYWIGNGLAMDWHMIGRLVTGG